MTRLFDTLTRALDGTRIVPWLAAGGPDRKRRPPVPVPAPAGRAFHDGRRLTARDVRSSWERLLLTDNRQPVAALSHPRRAAGHRGPPPTSRASTSSLRPSSASTSRSPSPSSRPSFPTRRPPIVPEGTGPMDGARRERVVGTGPFRLVAFDPGRRLELERNPTYWREGYPRCDGIVFRFGVSSQEIRSDFLAGRFSLAVDLLPADAEAFRHDPRFASRYRESPRLTTYYADLQPEPGPVHGRGAAPELRARRRRPRTCPPHDRPARDPRPRHHPAGPPRLLGARADESEPVTCAPPRLPTARSRRRSRARRST